MSKLSRNRQFNLCERINRARALVESVYADTGSSSEYSDQACKVLEALFDEQFAHLIAPVEQQCPNCEPCKHESWEGWGTQRTCVDCRAYLGPEQDES